MHDAPEAAHVRRLRQREAMRVDLRARGDGRYLSVFPAPLSSSGRDVSRRRPRPQLPLFDAPLAAAKPTPATPRAKKRAAMRAPCALVRAHEKAERKTTCTICGCTGAGARCTIVLEDGSGGESIGACRARGSEVWLKKTCSGCLGGARSSSTTPAPIASCDRITESPLAAELELARA